MQLLHFTQIWYSSNYNPRNFALRNNTTMNPQTTLTLSFALLQRRFTKPLARRFLREVAYMGTFLSASVYAWVRLLFHDMPFNLLEESWLLLRIVLAGMLFAAICIGGCQAAEYAVKHYKLLYHRLMAIPWRVAKSVAVLIIVSVLFACSGVQVSIKKDLNTGLITTSRGMQAAEATMLMHDEAMKDATVVLGQSFFIVNEGVKGLTVKDGKVSAGCALLITDMKGHVLLSEQDLFKGNDVFDKDKAGYLRCLVNTGRPMQAKQKYLVSVVFTDKYGKGSIENKVEINVDAE